MSNIPDSAIWLGIVLPVVILCLIVAGIGSLITWWLM